MNNIYYNPEKFGLRILYEFDRDLSYEFDMTVFWINPETGLVYVDSDAGCSCPSPFEESSMATVSRVETLTQAEEAFPDWASNEERMSARRILAEHLND